MANGTSGRLDSIIQRDDRNAQNSFQQSESYLSRNLQERMQTKALRQNLLLGGINAAVNVGQLGLGVANYVQRGKQIDQQGNLQQQEIDQRGQQLAQQQENSQVSELLAGGAAASSIASNVMSMKRQKDQFDLSVTRGNERMLQNVSNDQDKIILERINAADPEALDEGLRKKLVTYPRHVESELRSVNARIAQIQADDTYTPQARQRAISVLSGKQQALRWQVEPNPGKPMSGSELHQSQIGVISDPRDANFQVLTKTNRSGDVTEFVPEQKKIEWDTKAKKELQEHEYELKAKYGDGGGSAGSTASGKSRTNMLEEIDTVRTQLHEQKIEQARQSAINTAKQSHTGNTPFDANSVKFDEAAVPPPTSEEVFNRAMENRRLMLAIDRETEKLRQNPQLLDEASLGRKPAFWPTQRPGYPPIRQPDSMDRLPPTDPSAPQAPLPQQLPESYPSTEPGAPSSQPAPAGPELAPASGPAATSPAPAQPAPSPQRAKQIVKAIPINVKKHLPKPTSPAERDKLPRGTLYIAPDGSVRRTKG
jgi:hypothetical protein